MDVTAACDFFVVPTATHPTAAWTARQILEAFPGEVPRLLLRDRDGIYGWEFEQMGKALGIRQIRSAPHSPWQNGFGERVIGSIRRECTDHIIPFGRRHLLRVLREYVDYYSCSTGDRIRRSFSPFAGAVYLPEPRTDGGPWTTRISRTDGAPRRGASSR